MILNRLSGISGSHGAGCARFSAILGALIFGFTVHAQITANCLSPDGDTVKVPVIVGHPGDFAISGRGKIYVDPAIQRFSNDAQNLIFNHECHHATNTYVDEDKADYYAGVLMRKDGYTRAATLAAAQEVFAWTNTNNGHSVPLIRVNSVMSGFSYTDVDGDLPRECKVTEAEISGIDVSDSIPDYVREDAVAIQRRIASRQKLLDEVLSSCRKDTRNAREYPDDRDFRNNLKESRQDIAKYRAQILELQLILGKLNK